VGTAQIVHLPRSNLSEGDYDPNLSRRFSGNEMKEVWKKIDSVAVQEVRKLVLAYEPHLEHELTAEALALRIAKIAGFFLRESAKSIESIAYADAYAKIKSQNNPGFL
jgi:hypothetical protein